MNRKFLALGLLALPIVPHFAASAHASSITCYGSIVITTLGTEGMAITVPDGAIVQPNDPGAGPGFSVDAGSGMTISPASSKLSNGSPTATPAPGASGGSGGSRSSAGGSGGGIAPATVTAAKAPTDPGPVTIVDGQIPVAAPPNEQVPMPPVDLPPSTPIDSPVLQAIGEIPVEPLPNEPNGGSGGGGVSNTPEPATLTLLSLAGFGGWFKLRRRK